MDSTRVVQGFIAWFGNVTSDPLIVATLFGLTFSLTLIILGNYDLMSSSLFQNDSGSFENTVVLACILAMSGPLLIDIILDLFTFKEASYLGFRFLSIFTIVASSLLSLAFQQTAYAGAVTCVAYSWAIYQELSLVVSFLHHLVPTHFTYATTLQLMALPFVGLLLLNLNAISSLHGDALFALFYVFLGAFLLRFAVPTFTWLQSLHVDFKESKKPFRVWFTSLESAVLSALALLIATGSTLLLFLIFFLVTDPAVADPTSIPNSLRIASQVSLSFLCVFTYVMPSRLFKQELFFAKKDLDTKTEFIKYISHEIRSPAAVVLVGLELLDAQLTDGSFDKDIAEVMVEDMRSSMVFLVEILDDLLLYEKLERNNIKMNFEIEKPASLFKYIVEGFEDDFKIVPIDENANAHLKNLRIKVDMTKIKAVFNTLFKLCLKGKLTGAVNVYYKTGTMSEPVAVMAANTRASRNQNAAKKILPFLNASSAQVFTIVIIDRKSGLTLKDIDQLMGSIDTNFERVGHDDGEGSGFGLWIAKRLLHFHDATVDVNMIGDGLVYEISFPVIVVPEEPEEALAGNQNRRKARFNMKRGLSASLRVSARHLSSRVIDKKVVSSDTNSRRSSAMKVFESDSRTLLAELMEKHMHVLIVDDSSMIRKMVCQLMKTLGHTYVEAADGEKAVELVKASMLPGGTAFDTILMDNQMPTMLGHEAARIIRQELGYQGMILGVTGNAMEEDINEFITSGANQVILKPLTKDVFNNAVNKFPSRGLATLSEVRGVASCEA